MLFKDIGKILTNSEHLSYILHGLGSTLLITLIAAAIGLVRGCVVAHDKRTAKHRKTIQIPAFI